MTDKNSSCTQYEIEQAILFKDCPLVQCTPGRLNGAPAMVSSPRVPVDALITNFGGGQSIEEIAEMFLVSEEDVRGIIKYWLGLGKEPAPYCQWLQWNAIQNFNK
jgi:uncharacterized protein (DUF433 family)